MAKTLVRIVGSGFGLGLSPVAPGTCGTLLGVALAFLLPPIPWLVFAMAVFVVAGLSLARLAERQSGSDDPGWFVLDEVAGYLFTICWVPLYRGVPEISWQVILAGFVLFRLFDILKPWPIKRFELLPGGWGVMMDDLVAALYAAPLLFVLLLLWL